MAGTEPDSAGVWEAVLGLSVRQRAVVYLAYWEDLTPPRIADRLSISEGAVRRHLARAREHLSIAVAVIVALVADRSAVSSHVAVRPVATTATAGAKVKGPGPAGFPAPLGPIQESSASRGAGGEGVNGVVVHLVVDADGVTGGAIIHGHLQVINNTHGALRGGQVCRADVFAAVIYGGQFPERPVFPAASCGQPFAFRVGVTTLPFTVSVDYDTPSGRRPLPTGYYHVGVVVHGPRIPVPGPLTVIVLPRPRP